MTAKSTSRRLLFEGDHDRQRYLQLLAREIRQRRWQLLTFCLLSNHLHLLIKTPEPDLGDGMKIVHETFAQRTNRARGEGGHLFGARFYNGIVASERHVHGCLRYIARNPVEAGLCATPADWPWSAHRALAGLDVAAAFLDIAAAHEYLGRDPLEAQDAYIRLVAMSNAGLLEQLAQAGTPSWIAKARDDFAVPMEDLMAFLGLSRSATYERLVAARRTQVSVP